MIKGSIKHARPMIAPMVAIALTTALSGCYFINDLHNEVSGVPLDKLDVTGSAPTFVQLAGPDSVIISQGDVLSIRLEGSEDAGDAVRFDLDGDDLTIARDTNVYDGSGTAIIRITMPAPSELAMAGSGSIQSATLSRDSEITIAGSGSITVDMLAADALEISIAGSGSAIAAGTAKSLEVSIAGSGDVRAADLTANEAEISIAGSGDVDLASDGQVIASIAGSGDIRVTGTAKCTSESFGSGSITCNPGSPSEPGGNGNASSE